MSVRTLGKVALGLAALIGLLIVACLITTHCISQGIRNSLGNKIDQCLSYYLLCGRNADRFARYKPLFLGPETLFPAQMYNPVETELGASAGSSKSTSVSGLLDVARAFPTTAMNRMRGNLWESDNPALSDALPFARVIARRFIDAARTNPKDTPLPEDIDTRIAIHIRMSDVPFNRHPSYMLYPVAWYAAAVDTALGLPCFDTKSGVEGDAASPSRKCTGITIVSCFTHGVASAHHKYICGRLVETYQQALSKQFNLPVTTQCGTVQGDFHLLASAPVLIAGPSSFSFYAGVTSDNYFITTSPWTETLAALPSWKKDGKLLTLPPAYIPHDTIADYNNTRDILDKIQQS